MSKVKKDMGYVNRFTDTVPGRTALAGWAASSALGLALGACDDGESNLEFWLGLIGSGAANHLASGFAGKATRNKVSSATAQYFIMGTAGSGFSMAAFTGSYAAGVGLKRVYEIVAQPLGL